MRLGFSITKLHLFHLVRLNEAGFAYIHEQTITGDDLYSIDNLDAIRDKYSGYKAIDDRKLLLALHYIKVRNFLKSMVKVPYFDVDARELHNVEVLMQDKDIATTSSTTIMSAVDRLSTLPTALTSAEGGGSKSAASAAATSTASQHNTINLANVIGAEALSKFEAPQKVLLDNRNATVPSSWNRQRGVLDAKAGPVKAIASTGWIQTNPTKRLVVKATSKVQYLSDSDGDEDTNSQPDAKRKNSQTERAVPQWISSNQQKTGSKGNSSQPRR